MQDRISGFPWRAGMPADSLWKEHLPSSFDPLGVQPPGPGRAGAHTPAPLSTRPWGAPRPHNLGLLFLCALMGAFQGQCPGPTLRPDGGPDGWGSCLPPSRPPSPVSAHLASGSVSLSTCPQAFGVTNKCHGLLRTHFRSVRPPWCVRTPETCLEASQLLQSPPAPF